MGVVTVTEGRGVERREEGRTRGRVREEVVARVVAAQEEVVLLVAVLVPALAVARERSRRCRAVHPVVLEHLEDGDGVHLCAGRVDEVV